MPARAGNHTELFYKKWFWGWLERNVIQFAYQFELGEQVTAPVNKPGGDRVHVCVMGLKWGIRVWYM
jgi:hypothetical protein